MCTLAMHVVDCHLHDCITNTWCCYLLAVPRGYVHFNTWVKVAWGGVQVRRVS